MLSIRGEDKVRRYVRSADGFDSGLFRLGRRARPIRSLGEGPRPGPLANVRHLWSEVFARLDEPLAPAPAKNP
ncbi:hypothetical protein TA3x_000614 [Tundrisphaera sp. TA3]|uniref:hypothetical protein n=1 Tax=Tundrisphaera sp. TA3 TaxID=3435775 RepID=UPI003EB9C9F7